MRQLSGASVTADGAVSNLPGRHCSDHAVEQWARTVLMSAAPWQHGAGLTTPSWPRRSTSGSTRSHSGAWNWPAGLVEARPRSGGLTPLGEATVVTTGSCPGEAADALKRARGAGWERQGSRLRRRSAASRGNPLTPGSPGLLAPCPRPSTSTSTSPWPRQPPRPVPPLGSRRVRDRRRPRCAPQAHHPAERRWPGGFALTASAFAIAYSSEPRRACGCRSSGQAWAPAARRSRPRSASRCPRRADELLALAPAREPGTSRTTAARGADRRAPTASRCTTSGRSGPRRRASSDD
jgi:hypothetical protein